MKTNELKVILFSIPGPTEYLSTLKIRNNCSAAELWIEFFEFYSLGFNVNDDVVSLRNVGGFSRDEKQWKGKKLAIEGKFFFDKINNNYLITSVVIFCSELK
jgi:hypothetical protein